MSKSPFDLSIDHILSAGNIGLKWSRVFYELFSVDLSLIHSNLIKYLLFDIRFDILSFLLCQFQIAVELLGRFHGNMYALKLTDECNFKSMKDSLIEARFSIDGATTEWMHCLNFGAMRAIQAVQQTSESNNLVPSKFLERLSQIVRSVYFYQWDCVKPKEPYAVICHGDYLRNNIAFRYDENGLVNDAMMFDFQTMRYSSPMIDMSTFLANSTGCEVRNKHFKQIFKAYHDALTLELLANAPGWNQTDIPDYLTYVRFAGFSYLSHCFQRFHQGDN